MLANLSSLMFSYLARTIKQRTNSHLFLPYILTSLTAQHGVPNPSYSHTTHNLLQAFHQTPGIQSPKLNLNQFSTLDPSDVHTLYETLNFTQIIECHSNERTNSDIIKLVKLLRSDIITFEGAESIDFLDESDIKPTESLISSVIWELRDEWKLGFFAFKWGQKWRCVDEKNWSLMIWVLGTHKEFNNAWCLIRDLYQSSMNTQRAMLILIDRYAFANEPSEAIRTFQIMEKFKLSPDQNAFYTLLYTLSKHGNVEEAEEFMFQNKKLFPLEIEGFNIILSGWCTIFNDIIEAKRIWKEMDKCQIIPDENSYTYMISCFSKSKNLFDSLRLYDEMKKKGWTLNENVFNSLIYVLAHENCHEEALRMLEKMKDARLKPNFKTYNSLLRPLCVAGKREDAKKILSKMLEENVGPNVDTYHAFLEGVVTFEESLDLLERMVRSGNGPTRETLAILVEKFLGLNEFENALKIWLKMKEYGVVPASEDFVVMVEGLVKNGLIVKARELYDEMRFSGVKEDPKLVKLMKECIEYECRKKEKGGGVRMYRGKKWVNGNRSRT